MSTHRCFQAKSFVCCGLLFAAFSAAAYLPVRGTYNGMFFESDGVWRQSAGIVTMSTTADGRYSGQLLLGPYRYAFAGYFDGDGYRKQSVGRLGLPTLLLEMQVDSEDPDLIYGTVSGSGWASDLVLDRAVYSKNFPSPDQGQYTLLIPGASGSSDQPGGNSYGTISVDASGRVRFAGEMADGWKLTQSATISKFGNWPLFASLYRGNGVLWGWMLFNGSTDEDLAGDVTWIKPYLPWDWFYPEGFALQVASWGSFYIRPPKGTPVLDLPEAAVELNGGGLYENLLNKIAVDYKSKVVNLGPNDFSMKFTASNGLFKGKFRDPITGNTFPFGGVALQRFSSASGFFRGYDQTGEVWIEPW